MTDEATTTTTNGHPVFPGCVLDGHWGWHNHRRMIDVASELGFPVDDETQALVDRYDTGDPSQTDDGDFEIVNDLMTDAEAWLNDHTPDGFLWHWRDGEFFLSPWCGGDDDQCDNEMCAHWD